MGLFGKKDTKEPNEEKPKDGSITAIDIVKKPELIAKISGKYTILTAVGVVSLTNYVSDDIVKAINLMAEAGWRCVNITAQGSFMVALMERD
jgi:hypothetical protein